MKKKKYLLLIIAVLLVGIGSFMTYSIYRTSLSGDGSLDTAAWSIVVKKGSTEVQTTDFTLADFDFTGTNNNTSKVDNKIAPGSTGTLTYTIDATGSEVDVVYDVEVDDSNLPDGFTVTADDTGGTIEYSTTANAMVRTITLTATWTGTDGDTSAKDLTDLAANGQNFTVPVTITASQAL